MPYVNIKITREGATPAQKAELIAGVTDLLQRVLNKNPATTVVVIDEVAGQWIALLPVAFGAASNGVPVERLWPGWIAGQSAGEVHGTHDARASGLTIR